MNAVRAYADDIELVDAFAAIIRPRQIRTPDVWADETRRLAKGSAERGQFRSSRAPYVIATQRDMVDPACKGSVLVCSAQSGKTDAGLNVFGERADEAPTPMLYIGPSKDFVTDEMSPRLVEMLQSTDELWGKVSNRRKYKKTQMTIAGVKVRLGWAGSAKQLAGFPAGLAWFDERDQAEKELKGQGDPIEMMKARGRTFPGYRWLVTSTITNGSVETYVHEETRFEHWKVPDADEDPYPIQSATWRLWQEGTRHEWAWPCPSCREYWIPRFKYLHWPKGSSPDEAARNAWLKCPRCGAEIRDTSKAWMNARGEFVSPGERIDREGRKSGAGVESSVRTRWVSGLASAWTTFGDLARDWLQAVRSGEPGRRQGVLNLGFAELYSIVTEAPDWQAVLLHRGGYESGVVPEGVLRLVCSVDVQKDRLIWGVRGWGYRMESWGIAYGEIIQPAELEQAWADLEAQVLRRTFANGEALKLMLVDSGYRPGDKHKRPDHMVYSFARRFPNIVRATRGQETMDRPINASRIDVSVGGHVVPGGLTLWHLDTDFFKSFVVSKLAAPAGELSTWHLPHDVSDAYCQQVTAETRVTRASGRAQWVRVRKANHFFDIEAMNVAGAYMLNMHLLVEPPRATESRPAAPVATERKRWIEPRQNWLR